jgi:hypothetical protein
MLHECFYEPTNLGFKLRGIGGNKLGWELGLGSSSSHLEKLQQLLVSFPKPKRKKNPMFILIHTKEELIDLKTCFLKVNVGCLL